MTASAAAIPFDVTGLLDPLVGVVSNVRASCFDESCVVIVCVVPLRNVKTIPVSS